MKIGVFDSGLGGLVITKAFIQTMPEFDYCYYGDTKNLPYGEKTSGQILSYTLEAVKYLIAQDCKLIIIACNTATSIALRYLQQRFIPAYAPDIKVLGVVIPTVEEAVFSGAGTIGVIATPATVRSHIYQTELLKLNPNLKILELATPKLVPMIENNQFDLADEICQEYAQPFWHADSLILGCTHYPFLMETIRRVTAGRGVTVIDPSPAVARHTAELLDKWNLRAEPAHRPEYRFLTFADDAYRERLRRKAFAADIA